MRKALLILTMLTAVLYPSAVGATTHTAIPQPAVLTDRDTTIPVLYVHGYINTLGGCAGVDSVHASDPTRTVLGEEGWTGPVLGVDYYCGDNRGQVNIRDAGDGHCADPTQSYGNNTKIERLGCDFAWKIYQTFGTSPVDIVAHSMGGLITRYALYGVQAHLPGFPAALTVPDVVTLSTPHGGGATKNCGLFTPTQCMQLATNCGTSVQCQEMTIGSPFLTNLATNGKSPLADWTVEGGGPKDCFTYDQATAIGPNAHHVNYYATAPMNYAHTDYPSDTSLAQDEPYTLTQPDGAVIDAVGDHSLVMVYDALRSDQR